jgi:hypothetical protein
MFQKFTKSEWITMNSNSIIKFISYCLWKIYKPLRKLRKNIGNKNCTLKAQLSLFSSEFLLKTREI